ncbi:MAG: glycosyltransferase family 2 protein [Thermoanaerobaculia bacterium]|jgi:putative glycosyltransferase
MELSIVTSLYRSAPYLGEFYRRVSKAAEQLGRSFEIILVNDGSPDDVLEIALELRANDSRVCVVDLSRNFGHHKAMMTGLAYARGTRVFLLDADLEEEPELLLTFSETMDQTAADVVFGVQDQRKGRAFERLSGTLFYRFFNAVSAQQVVPNQLCARLMTRRYVDSLLAHRDREIFLMGLWAVTGYRQVALEVRKQHKGTSTYTLPRKVDLAVDAVTSFSNRPLVLLFYLGTLILIMSILGAVYLITRRLFFGHLLPGWASTMVTIGFMGGLNLFSVGLVGIYLSKVFSETKDRPYTVVREVYPSDSSGLVHDGVFSRESGE